MEKKEYLIKRIRGRAAVGLIISLFVSVTLLVAMVNVWNMSSVGAAESEPEPTATVYTTLAEITAAESVPGFYEVTVADLKYIRDIGEQDLFVAVLPATGEGVLVEINQAAIPEVNNPPTEYRIAQAYSSTSTLAGDYVREALFGGSFDEFEAEYTSCIIVEVPAALPESAADTSSSWGEYGIGIAIFLLPLAFLLFHLFRLLNPRSHKAYKRLAADSRDIGSELDAMDREIAGDGMKKFDQTMIMPSWVIDESFTSLKALRMEAIIWFYRVNIKTRRNGFTAKTYAMNLCDKGGNTYSINRASEKKIDDMLAAMVIYNSGAVTGYSGEIEQMFNNDIDKLIAEVNRARSR